MPNTIRIDTVNDVRIFARQLTAIACRDHRGIDTDVVFSVADVPKIAPALLCCAAIEAGPNPKPQLGTIVPGCLLSVMAWRVGRSNINGEPVLEIDVAGGATLQFQFPGTTARDCGRDLEAEGAAASPPPGARPN